MPLFHDPNHGPEEKLKIELKRWERSFVKINDRKPGKDDIEAAGEDVSHMYRKYWSVIKGHPLQSQIQKCKKTEEKEPDAEQPAAAATGPGKLVSESSSSHASASLPAGVWGDDLLKKNFNPRPEQKADDSLALRPFLTQLRKLHLREDNVKKNLVKGLFSLKKKKKQVRDPSADQLLDFDKADGPDSETSAAFPSLVSEQQLAPDQSPASLILTNIYSDISPSSGFSSGSSMKESECSNQSFVRPPSSSGCPSIRLFDEDDFSTESEIAKVKETFAETLQDVVFDGCELLPIDFKEKKKKKPPTAAALKKRNENNFVKINMKKKSYASRGYKKLDVAKEKRKAHYKAKRDRCFTCGESGHWRHECPLINKQAAKKSTTATVPSEAGSEADADANQMNYEDIPFLPEDHVIMSEAEDEAV